MAELCLVASHCYLPGSVLQQEDASSKDPKPILQSPGTGHDIIRSAFRKLKPIQCEDPLKPVTGFLEFTQFVEIDSIVRKPVLVDVQDTNPDSVFLTYGIAGMCNRREQILQNLVRGLSEEKSGLDFSLRSDMMGFQTFSSDSHGRLLFAPSLIYPSSEFDAQNPLVDFVADLARGSKVMVNPDDKVLFSGSMTEMKDILSIVAEFNLSKDPTKWRKQPFLVPYFDRLDSLEVQMTTIHGSSLNPKAVTVAPAKSPEKIQLKPLTKKKKKRCGNVGRGRDLYKRNSFHACEILLSLMMNKRLKGKTAIVSLKKSGPELPELLTQFSAGIAGTGLAVFCLSFAK